MDPMEASLRCAGLPVGVVVGVAAVVVVADDGGKGGTEEKARPEMGPRWASLKVVTGWSLVIRLTSATVWCSSVYSVIELSWPVTATTNCASPCLSDGVAGGDRLRTAMLVARATVLGSFAETASRARPSLSGFPRFERRGRRKPCRTAPPALGRFATARMKVGVR
ncbi:hypothetical protein VTK26DRAFT_1021 [Humicola hyalothermophila]